MLVGSYTLHEAWQWLKNRIQIRGTQTLPYGPIWPIKCFTYIFDKPAYFISVVRSFLLFIAPLQILMACSNHNIFLFSLMGVGEGGEEVCAPLIYIWKTTNMWTTEITMNSSNYINVIRKQVNMKFFDTLNTMFYLYCALLESIYLTECWGQFKAVLEKRNPSKYVETKSSTWHSHYQTAYISQMPNCLCPHQGKQDVVILLTLILVHCGHLIQ
jgi:hypothetical protein